MSDKLNRLFWRNKVNMQERDRKDSTTRWVRTKYGLESFVTIAACYWKLVDGVATVDERHRVWEVLKTVFGETGSIPPQQLAGPPHTK